MALLGTLQLDLSAPTDRLSSDLNRAQQIVDRQSQMMARSLSGLVAEPLVMKVDDKALTSLNQHLSLKQAHYRQVQADFDKPLVLKAIFSDSNAQNSSKSIEKAVKEGISKGMAGNPFVGIGKLVTAPLADVSRGVFENLGKELSGGLSKGLADSINKSLSGVIGSQSLVGEKIGDAISAKVGGKIGKETKREITNLAVDTLGQESIDRESGSMFSRYRKSQSIKDNSAAQELNYQRQQTIREKYEQIAKREELNNIKRKTESRVTALSDNQEQTYDELLEAKANKSSNIGALTQKSLNNQAKLSEAQSVSAAIDNEIAVIDATISRSKIKEESLSKRIDVLAPSVSPYQKSAELAAGRKLKPEEVPHVIVADSALQRIRANASYKEDGNLMYVTSELDRQARDGKLTGKNQETLLHESVHADDFGFGSIEGIRAEQRGEVLRDRKLSASEVEFAAPFAAQSDPNQQATELNAYGMQYRYREQFAQQDRKLALNQFQQPDNYGFAGAKYKSFVSKSSGIQKQELGDLVGILPAEEVKELIQIKAKIKSHSDKIVKQINSSVGKGFLAEGLEDAIDGNIAEIEQFGKILNLSKQKASKAKVTTVGDIWDDSVGLVKGGIENVGKVGNAIGKVTNPVIKTVRAGYGIAEGIESAVLPFIPFGQQIKSVGKNIALPAAAYAGLGMLPGGQVAQAALGGAMHSALALPEAAAMQAISGAAAGSLGGIPMLGGALSTALTTAIGGALEGAIAIATPILAGKVALQIGAKLALPPSTKPQYDYIEAGRGTTQKAIAAGQSLVQTELVPYHPELPAAQLKLAIGGNSDIDTDYRPAGRDYIKKLRQKMDSAIAQGNKKVAETLYDNFDRELSKFKAFVESAATPSNRASTIDNLGVIGKWEKVKADRARKIEQIGEDGDEDLGKLKRQLTPKQKSIREESVTEIEKLEAQKQGIKARLQSARQAQDEFKRFKATPKPDSMSHNEYDETRARLLSDSTESRWDAGNDGRLLKQVNKNIRTHKAEIANLDRIDSQPKTSTIDRAKGAFDKVRNVFNPPAPITRVVPITQTVQPTPPVPPTPPTPPTPPVPPVPVISPAPTAPIALTSYFRQIPDPWVAISPIPQPDKPIDIVAMKRLRDEAENGKTYDPSGAGRRFDNAFDRANRNIDRSFDQSTQGISKELDRIAESKGKIDPVTSSFDKLFGIAKVGLGIFGGYALLTTVGPMLLNMGRDALATASNFEVLAIKLTAASDSIQTGKNIFAQTTAFADKIGTSRSSALETQAAVSGTTFGTELEGDPSQEIGNQITQLSKLRGLSKQETGSLTLALNQTLGRERVSMQEINQLTQSGGITDARAIAARGLGYTPQQFSKVQESSTGLDPRLFVTSFLRQGINDALLSKGTVENSAQSKEMRFDSNKEKIAGAFGAVVNPAYKGGIDLLNGAIELLSSVSGLAGAALTGFIVKSIIQLGVTIVPLISEYIIYNGLLANSGKYLVQNSGAMAGSLLKMGLWTAGFIAIGDGIAYIMDRLKNQYSDMAKTTNELSDAIDKAEGKKPSSNDGLVKNDKDVVKNDANLAERGGLAAQSAVSGFIQSSSNFGVNTANFLTKLITGKDPVSNTASGLPQLGNQSQKNAEDREEQFDKTTNTIKRGIKHTREVAIPKAAALEKIDIELSAINTERSGLFSSGDPDARKLEDVMSRSAAKYKERQKLAAELTPDGSIIQQAVNEAKNKAAKLESEKANKSISQSAYDDMYPKIQQEIKDATEAQNDFNKAIRNGLDDLTPWTRELSKIAAKFEDINVAADTSTNQFTVVKNKLETTGRITKGQAEYGASQNKDQILVAKNAAIDKTISELKFALNSKDPNAIKNVQKAYGVNDSTSSAQLKVLSDTATSPQDKQVLAQLATIRDKRNEQIGTLASISDARAEVYRKIYDENRQAMLYYVSLAQQLDPKNNEFNQAISKISTSKNAFLAKLNNFGSGLFDIYTTAYIALLDAGKEKLESQAKAAQERKAALDAYQNRSIAAQEQERTRFTPSSQLGKAANGQPVDSGNATTKTKVTQGRNPATTPDGRSFTTNNIDPTSATSVKARLGKKPANWVEAGEQASIKVYQQSIINANRTQKLSTGESELKKVMAIQALEEGRIKTAQSLASSERKRKLERLDPNDEIKQEGKQKRERLTQDNQLADDKDNKINDVRSLTNSLNNAKLTISSLKAKPVRTPEEEKVLSAAQSDMARNQNGLKQAQVDLAGFDKLAASKKASLEREQKYQREVTAENNALKVQADRVDKLKGSLQGLNQQLQSQPFNEAGKAISRTQTTEIAKQEADMALVRAKRDITDRQRSSDPYTPQVAAANIKIATDIRNKAVQNAAQKQIQESIVSQNAYNAERKGQELTGYNIASNENAIKVKSYQISEKGDAPFASSMSIEAEFAQKLVEFKKLEAEREKIITKQRIDYGTSTDPTTGNNELLTTAEAQNEAQKKQNQASLNLDRKSNAQSLNQFGIGKRGYEFGQSIKFFDADAAQRASERDGIKQRGGDTRELDFDLAVRAKQKEAAVKVQDLQSQRDAITEDSEAAKKARAEIDNLIASTKALSTSDISNISDQFDRFNQVIRKVQDTSQEVFTTWLQTGKFDWRKILLSGLDDALKQITAKLVPDLFSGLFRKSEKTASTSITEGIAKTLTDGGSNPQVANPIVNSALTQQDGVADPIISQPSMVVDGMVKLALPGGGFRTLSRQDAISDGFINIDGTSTTAPKPQPTINLTPPETFNFNQDDNGQIQQLQQDLFAPQPIIAPPMPLDEFDGLGDPPPGYRRGDNGYDIRRLPMPNRRSDAGGSIGSSLLSMGIPFLTKLLGFADGGIVPADPSFKSAREGDNPIANALKKEGHDAIIAALTPGERILNLRETRIYQTMFPKGISNYNDGGVAGGITPIPLNLDKGKARSGDNNEFNFSIDNSGKGADGQLSSRQMIDGLRSVVVQELLRQKRNGSGLVN